MQVYTILVLYSHVLFRQSLPLLVQCVEVALNVPALEEAPCGGIKAVVYDLCFGQVHTMTCGPYMLCQGGCSDAQLHSEGPAKVH